ncbi:MAG TPA: PfkB family carbohydrate kinase [Planctomycetaceae bacterium]|nr:PfkB family carbohydrate kinase [Planctomycetaceae bacterium]
MTVLRNIAGLGTTLIDWQMTVAEFPQPDTKHLALSSRMQVGGPVPTALALLCRFGHRCSLVSLWGNDPQGEMIERDLALESISFDPRCRRQDGRTGTAHVWIKQQSGERTIVGHHFELIENDLGWASSYAADADLMHVDGWGGTASVEAARTVRENGGIVSLDTGSPKPVTSALLGLASVVNAPLRFLKMYFNDEDVSRGGRRLLELGAELVTVTDGTRGAWLFTERGEWHQPAFEIDAVDTTGAGDVFTGALIHAWLQDWPPEQILRFASACAALKCERYGNRDALPALSRVDQFLSERV